ncbi:PREDICTED: putative receptor-like protein kinase At4g00960 isoform X2 [Ipomoea nil]|uniref:putative receptor-like protein kinase At4g00960 isoform X2 n=1 Tax=Ipomoea nil TaxID=35883 RepID=UPI000900D11D|nr:PREDICTED: putative receptor-like protein kinase At4g00960 isoform X2 [Ipomoea nil]
MMVMIWFWLLMSFIDITKGIPYLSLRINCPKIISSYYTLPNSTYRANLDLLLSNLYSNATRDNGFYHTTVGDGSSNDTLHGLFLCRGDLPPYACRNCIGDAREEILELCGGATPAIIWFDECMLRYSHKSMFGILDTSTYFTVTSKGDNDTQPNGFIQLVQNMMGQLITPAALSTGNKKFAVLEANFSVFETVYALGQCTPDLSNDDCQICLTNAISMLSRYCFGALGARAVFPNCNVRYEIFAFYHLSALRTPAAPTIVPNSATTKGNKGKSSAKVIIIIIAASIVSAIGILLFVLCFYFLKMRRANKSHSNVKEKTSGMTDIPTEQSTQYDFSTIQAVTNYFSPDNKIGKGGYGAVYKGRLPNGQEVAVKRLSKNSTQGSEEFKNEVALVAKLQHRNLVKLLGFCLQGEEKILIYEFVPNKSLDYFLFDPEKKHLLNWFIRYKIIGGIARGILYLHEDSHLKIIHRDLKASNVLLDGDMNSKISDFGLARIFMFDQTHGNTSRVIGTYGYMSPEYVLHGLFSVKSDVFSFGVLLLEIITGKKNSSLSMHSTGTQDLLSYAWKHWMEGKALDMVDQSLGGLYSRNEVIQCIHVGLLCVQEEVEDRPTMANVVLMLNSHSATRNTPNPPAFFNGFSQMISAGEETDQSRSKPQPLSEN